MHKNKLNASLVLTFLLKTVTVLWENLLCINEIVCIKVYSEYV